MNKAQLQTEAFNIWSPAEPPWRITVMMGMCTSLLTAIQRFLVPEKDVCLDTSKMRPMPSLKNLFVLGDGYTEAKLTKRCTMFDANGGILREYRAVDDAAKHVWVRESMMKRYCSEEYTAYIRDELGAVKFVNRATGKVDHIILPVRVCEGNAE